MEFLSTPDNRACLHQITSTQSFSVFMFIAEGDAMNRAGIDTGDLIIVDRAIEPKTGDVVLAEVNGEFYVRRLHLNPDLLLPDSSNKSHQPIQPETIHYLGDKTYLGIFGVVTHSVRRFVS